MIYVYRREDGDNCNPVYQYETWEDVPDYIMDDDLVYRLDEDDSTLIDPNEQYYGE